jgi:glycosyltransferase involved in cell wall biosynthesis
LSRLLKFASLKYTLLPKISICIPAYKRPENIRRLLNSIHIQTFQDFEIILTDDSPDDAVELVCREFPELPLEYIRNPSPKGTPANWNFAIDQARGEWIKIMHDDDWFSTDNSLELFDKAAGKGKNFIFSGYTNVWETGSRIEMNFPSEMQCEIIANPMLLLAENVIGPPSVTMVHSSVKQRYDTFMKWRVDIDFYVRLLRDLKDFEVIKRPLVNVGISESQVTNSCIGVPEVELPEGALLLSKYGVGYLKNWKVYDAWWRIIRNVGLRNAQQLEQYTPYTKWPVIIPKIISEQAKLPAGLLKVGVFSKIAMYFSFMRNKKLLEA